MAPCWHCLTETDLMRVHNPGSRLEIISEWLLFRFLTGVLRWSYEKWCFSKSTQRFGLVKSECALYLNGFMGNSWNS